MEASGIAIDISTDLAVMDAVPTDRIFDVIIMYTSFLVHGMPGIGVLQRFRSYTGFKIQGCVVRNTGFIIRVVLHGI